MPNLANDYADKISDPKHDHATPLSVGIVCDFVEENWPSMDLVGDMLLGHLNEMRPMQIQASCIRPSMSRRFSSAGKQSPKLAFNADRIINRFWDYPRFLRRQRNNFDIFHIVDHSYAQLVLELPAARTIVTCHDIETFRCLLEPEQEQRSPLFRALVHRTLRGLQAAAQIVCPSAATQKSLLAHGLIKKERLRVVPLGAHPSCSTEPNPAADLEVGVWLGPSRATDIDLLHVGSTVPRKRIDVVLMAFAGVRAKFPEARLIRVGGAFTAEQKLLVDRLGLADSIVVLPGIDRPTLAAIYRRVALTLLPSEREGFGLPVVEAMACGTPVVASDLPALREVGGDSASYCPVADVHHWVNEISELLRERRDDPSRWLERRDRAVRHAAQFQWNEYTKRMASIYSEVQGLEGPKSKE